MAECHVIGQLVGASDFPGKSLFCKYDIHFGESWKLISGLKEGQTQIDSPQLDGKTYWCHPIDVHFVTKSIQGWPKIHLEVYHQDEFGRSELYGYGFVYLPTQPGSHSLTCVTWRPTGSLRDDIRKFFLGGGYQLKKPDIVFTGTDRYRLQTETMGKVYIDVGIILRNFHKYGVECFETSDVQKHCNNEFCSTISSKQNESGKLTTPDVELNGEFYFANSTKPISEKEIYLFKDLEHTQDKTLHKNSYAYKLQMEATAGSIESTSKSVSSSVDYTENTEMINTTVGVLETTEMNFENVPNKSSSTTATTVKSVNAPTTPAPPLKSHFLIKQNFKKGNICFCDLKLNECDINCCCDVDCTQTHLKVFTKCNDNNELLDEKYCYKNYFIFANNTSHEVVQKNKGLFCIARENVWMNLDYESKPPLTTLEAFTKNLPEQKFTFSYKTQRKSEFKTKNYLAGSPVWTIQNGELKPFRIPYSSVGLLCNSEVNIKYLVDQVTTCFNQLSSNECEGKKIGDVVHALSKTIIISNPAFINTTQKSNSSKVCDKYECIKITSYICQTFDDVSECLKVTINSSEFLNIGCWNVLSDTEYEIFHNGSEGIVKLEAKLWVKKISKSSTEILLPFTTDVQYKWAGSSKKVFRRSGNPGYLTGKPVLAGRKIYLNETSQKKEAMEVSDNPNEWLNVLGSKKGICSSKERIPINFRENGQFICSLPLGRDNFTKENCMELQQNIYKLLIGQDTINFTKENYFNKFVATFGNSRVEETGDWVQVLIDLFPFSSSQSSFKLNHYQAICKNILTDLYIDIVYSNIGSVLAPQAKILGVYFHFGKYKDLTFLCDSPACGNTSLVQYFKLSTSVNFVDITKPPVDAFAEPLYLEAKLPHDFFYPFFSRGCRHQVLNEFVFILILSAFF